MEQIRKEVEKLVGVADKLYLVVDDATLYAVTDDEAEAEEIANYCREKSIQDEADEYDIDLDEEDGYSEASYMAGYDNGCPYVETVDICACDYTPDDTYTTAEDDAFSFRDILDAFRNWLDE